MQDSSRTIGLMIGALAGVGAMVALRSRWQRPPASESFADRVVVITGGARGLGLALARTWGAEGARLVLASRSEDELERARAGLAAAGADVRVRVTDVRDQASAAALVDFVLAQFGRLDVLVNNAGIIQVGPYANSTEADFEDSLATHFWGPFHLIKHALPALEASSGRIVNISSIGGRMAVPHLLPYCVGKFALAAFSDGLRAELADRGVSVLTVTPGLMRSGSHRNAEVRGQHEAEARWFALAGASPVTSMSVERVVGQIVEAARSREARVTPGVQARIAELVNVAMPELAARVAEWAVERVLPSPSSDGPSPSRMSRDLDLGAIAHLLPTRNAELMNQPVAADEQAARRLRHTLVSPLERIAHATR